MKAMSAAMLAHIGQPYQTLVRCWWVQLRNGTVLGFTEHDKNLSVDGVTYLASSGYTGTDIQSTDGTEADELEVQGMLTSPSITEDDLRAGIWDYARVQIFQVNWADLTMGRIIERVGTLGEVSTERSMFKAELRGLIDRLKYVIGELTSPTCRANWADERCGVDPAPFTVAGAITGINPDGVTFYDTTRGEPGPTGGVAILQVTISDPAEVTLVSALANMHDQMPVAIEGVVSFPEINSIWRIHPIAGMTFTVPLDASGIPGTILNEGTVTPLGGNSGHFDFGMVTWTSGLNVGLEHEVKQYSPGQITLFLPPPYAMQVGDTYTMIPGCDKQLATCRDRYNNIVNFRGEPYLPGLDKVVQTARRG